MTAKYRSDIDTTGNITTSGTLSAGSISSPSLVGMQQFSSDGSSLRNLASQVHPAENLLKQAVWWIDSAHSSAGSQSITNLGWGGSVLNTQCGSSTSADSNDPLFLDWTGDNYVYLPGVSSNEMTVPDEAALDITGDLDIRVKVAMDDWTPAAEQTFIAKGGLTNDAYALAINTGGQLRLYWGNGTGFSKFSTVGVSISDGVAKWVRATLDVDNGASGNDVKFYTSDDGVSWSQLGDTVTTAGTTSVGAGTTVLRIGSYNGSSGMLAGKVYRVQVLNGIDGTPVLDIDCSAVASGAATSFTARTGQTVTINRSTSGRKAVAVVHPVWLLGTDDYLEVPDNDLIDFGASDSFTVVAVLRRWGQMNSAAVPIIGKMVSSGAGNTWALRSAANDLTSNAWIRGADSTIYQPAGASVTTGTTTSLALVVDRRAVAATIYTNGMAGTPTAITNTTDLSNSSVLRVCQYANNINDTQAEFIAGAIFRRALTPEEIKLITDYYKGRVA